MIIDKYTPLNAINDVWAPKYSTQEAYIACWKVNRSKLNIKLTFSKISDSNEYSGAWYISKKDAKKYKKKFDNNGVECYVIPMSAFSKLEYNNRSMHEIW